MWESLSVYQGNKVLRYLYKKVLLRSLLLRRPPILHLAFAFKAMPISQDQFAREVGYAFKAEVDAMYPEYAKVDVPMSSELCISCWQKLYYLLYIRTEGCNIKTLLPHGSSRLARMLRLYVRYNRENKMWYCTI